MMPEMLTVFVSLSSAEQLNIKVKDADGNEVFFKVKKHTRLAKLKRAYAERMGRPENAVRFITADGSRVGDEDTAETVCMLSALQCLPSRTLTISHLQLGLEDGDEIDAMVEQLGGMA